MGDQHQNHHGRGPKGGQSGRQALHRQTPDQHHHGQQKIQPRLGHGTDGGQELDLIATAQFRVLGGQLQQAQIRRQQQTSGHPGRGVPGDLFDPAQTVIHHRGQHDQPDQHGHETEQSGQKLAPSLPRQAFHSGLASLQMDDIDQGDIGNDGGQESVFDDFGIGDTDKLDHQERRRAHDGRGQLAVGGRRHFHRPSLLRLEADLAHQGNGEGPGSDHVGDGRTGHQPGHGRRHHRRLGRTAAQMAQQAEGHPNEIIARARPLQQGAEQHEQKHHGGGHAQGDAEHALLGDPHMRHGFVDGRPLPGDDLRRQMAEEHIHQKDQRDHHQRRPEGAARGLQQQHQTDDGDH